MKRLTLIILTVMLVLPFMVNESFAAGGHKFKYQEKYKDSYLCSSKYYYCDVYGFGNFKAQAQISLAEAGIDPSQFTDKTTISMSIYDWGFSTTLGEGGYIPVEGIYPKKGAAYYAYSGYDWWLEVGVEFLKVQVKWNKKKMTIKVTALTEPYETDEENDPWGLMVWNYMYEYDTFNYYEQIYTAVGIDVDGSETTDDDLQLIQFDVGCNIKTKTKEHKDGYEINNIKIKGSGYGYEVDELTLTETFKANGYEIPKFLLRQ